MDRTSDEDSHCCKNPIGKEQRISREDGPSHLRFSEKFLRSLDLFSSIGTTVDITPDEGTHNIYDATLDIATTKKNCAK